MTPTDTAIEPTRDLRVYAGANLDDAIQEICPQQDVHWDMAYAMMPSPAGMTLHGMVVFYFPNVEIGGPSTTISIVEDLGRLTKMEEARSTIRMALEKYGEHRAAALQMPADLKLVPGGPSMPIPGR